MPKTIVQILFVALSASALNWRPAASQPPIVGTISLVNAGALSVYAHDSADARSRYSIVASTYDTTRATYDDVFGLLYPGQTIGSNFTGMTRSLVSNVLYWPKEVQQVPGDLPSAMDQIAC